ncbi:MAG: DUF2829 domain-containing protein [Lachnospiraceae bacterium]|nr:DUF2829 domain-containing protein [Lachnospiraceae bacterium]
MKKDELMKHYEEVKDRADCIVLMIHMPGGETETITNPKVAEKIAYVDKTYDDDLVHTNCKDIFIEDVIFCLKDDTYDFGTAIGFLKDGMKVARRGWNGKGMFLYLSNGGIVPKEQFRALDMVEGTNAVKNGESVEYAPHIDMKSADGTVVIGWLASQTDMLAEDWEIVE